MTLSAIDNRLAQWAFRHAITPQAWSELLHLYDHERPDTVTSGPEAQVVAELQVAAPRVGCALWRNNKGATLDSNGRLVRYGLGNVSSRLDKFWKSSDLIGATPYRIESHHVGMTLGVFTAVEVKAPGWRGVSENDEHEQAQAAYLRTVEALGGIGMFCTSVEQYRQRIGK